MIRKILDATYSLIGKNRYLARTKPIVDAVDSFLYGTPQVTAEAPHVQDNLDLKRYMITVVIAVSPAVLASVYFFGLRSLFLIAISYIFGVGTEAIFAVIRKEEINEGAFVTCILYPLTLPPTLPWYWCALGIVFGIVFGKELFGGTGKNVFNPALVGRCFIFLCFPVAMAANYAFPEPATGFNGGLGGAWQVWKETDAATGATPLGERRTLTAATRGEYEGGMLEKLFWGNVSGSLGETSAALILLGGLLLMFTKVANWRPIVAALGSSAAFSTVMHVIDPVHFAGPLFTLLSGGLMFGVMFMVTDPVSGPITSRGRWIYGILIGVVVVLIRGISGYAEGVMFAILLGNVFAPLIDEAILFSRYSRKEASG